MTVYSGEVNKFSSTPNMHRSSLEFCWVMRLISKENDSTDNMCCVCTACAWSQKNMGFFSSPGLWDSVLSKEFSVPSPRVHSGALCAAHQWTEQSSLAISHTSQAWVFKHMPARIGNKGRMTRTAQGQKRVWFSTWDPQAVQWKWPLQW